MDPKWNEKGDNKNPSIGQTWSPLTRLFAKTHANGEKANQKSDFHSFFVFRILCFNTKNQRHSSGAFMFWICRTDILCLRFIRFW